MDRDHALDVLVLADAETIQADALPSAMSRPLDLPGMERAQNVGFKQAVDEFEKKILIEAIRFGVSKEISGSSYSGGSLPKPMAFLMNCSSDALQSTAPTRSPPKSRLICFMR